MMRHTLILFASVLAFAAGIHSKTYAQTKQEEFGKCGYYADALHGRKTASGELYDKTLLTAAHKSLPFGTSLRVTRLDNKKSVVVRVNDRGPFIDGYVVDISRKAAETIGLIRDGVTKVKIEVVNPTPAAGTSASTSTKALPADLEPAAYSTASRVASASDATTQLVKSKKVETPATVAPATYNTISSPVPQTVPAGENASKSKVSELFQIELNQVQGKGFGLQLAVLSSSEYLFQQVNKLQATWPKKVIVSHETTETVTTYKLIIGPFATRKEAEAQQNKAATKGFKKSFVVEFE